MAAGTVIINAQGDNSGKYSAGNQESDWGVNYFPAIYNTEWDPTSGLGFFLGHKPDGGGGKESYLEVNVGKAGGFTIDNQKFLSGNFSLNAALEQLKFDGGSVAFGSGTGVLIGKDGTDYELYAGNGTDYIHWDGTTLTVKGDITATTIFADSGTIGGFTISATQIYNSTNIVLDSSAKAFYINDTTFGNAGIQLEYNSGTPRAYIGNSTDRYFNFDGTNISFSSANTTLDTAGKLVTSSGTIGGWDLTSTLLRSAASNARIELNQGSNRVSIFDATNEKVIMGYLAGVKRNNATGTATAGTTTTLTDSTKDWKTNELTGLQLYITGGTGSGQNKTVSSNTATVITISGSFSPAPDATSTYEVRYTSADYGFWAMAGDTLKIDGDMSYENGDWIIQHDAAVKILDGSGNEIIRLGTDTGDKGLFIYDTSHTQLAKYTDSIVRVGTTSNYMQYNTTTSVLELAGSMTSTGTITGGVIRTADPTAGKAVVIDGANNNLIFYNVASTEAVKIDTGVYGTSAGIKITGGIINAVDGSDSIHIYGNRILIDSNYGTGT
ncbi:MAG: hypothetical protein ACE5D2_08155, partial [Fidelibacterota bacterium]